MKIRTSKPRSTAALGLFAAILAASSVPFTPSTAQEKKEAAPKKEEAKPAPAAESIFPDKNLEEAVRSAVYAKRDNKEPITAADVANVSTIKGRKMGIRNLAGLEHCKALSSLELPENEITDLGPIGGLERVQLLDLSDNQIEDISALAGMKGLQYVNIENNRVTSVTALEKLERLSSLYASGNRIADIKPLLGLPKLWSLYLGGNRIADISGIAGLKRVDTFGLAGNQIVDLSPLAGTNPTNALYLENNGIRDLAPLVAMCRKDLEGEKRFAPYVRIYLAGNPLDSPEAKSQLAELEKLGIRVIASGEKKGNAQGNSGTGG